ncbi:MAG: exodeoxyribonuclease VII large subunit [Alistipes sp.]
MTETSRRHLSLAELQALIANAVGEALPLPVWVSAEIAEIKVNYSGHCYLELVEKGDGADAEGVAKAQARAVIWRSSYPAVAARFERESGSRLAAGMKILCKAQVNYHPLYGLSLQITDIDAAYTLGDMERAKQQAVARLQSDGVWDMNREVPMPALLERIAVVSSATAAGWRDFMREAAKSPYRLQIELFDAVMQGAVAEQSIIDALMAIAESGKPFDAVAIIRGGGSTNDLNCFNSYRLASYIAQFPLPVLTGIGHDKDVSVSDMVAHTMLKTPTAVAVWLYERSAEADGNIESAAIRLRELCTSATHRQMLVLQQLTADIRNAASLALAGATARTANADETMRRATAEALERVRQRLDAYGATADNYTPRRLLQLGLGIARIGNKTLRSVDAVEKGDDLDLELADGIISATVTGKSKRQ